MMNAQKDVVIKKSNNNNKSFHFDECLVFSVS